MEIVTALGVGPKARPTVWDLVKRGVAVFDAMRAGQEGLDYLEGAEAVLGSELRLNRDNLFELVTLVPEKPQLVLIGHERPGRRRDDLGELTREDDRDAELKNETAGKFRASARLLDRVSEIISTDRDVKSALKRLEVQTGLESGPARRFLYQRQADFTTTVGGDELVEFHGQVVRPAVSSPDVLEVELHIVPLRADNLVIRTHVGSCFGGGLPGGFKSGGNHNIRIADPTWWQKVAIEGARALQLPVEAEIVETISTCTLGRLPADVHRVRNWYPLLEATHAAMGEVLTAARNAASCSTIAPEPELKEEPDDDAKAA